MTDFSLNKHKQLFLSVLVIPHYHQYLFHLLMFYQKAFVGQNVCQCAKSTLNS